MCPLKPRKVALKGDRREKPHFGPAVETLPGSKNTRDDVKPRGACVQKNLRGVHTKRKFATHSGRGQNPVAHETMLVTTAKSPVRRGEQHTRCF